MNNMNSKFLILLISVLVIAVQAKSEEGSKSSDGGPMAFIQKLFSGIGGGKKDDGNKK